MNTLLFAPETCNLAETTRMLEIAKSCRGFFDILFLSYGGMFEHLILQEGFQVEFPKPRLTVKKSDHLNRVSKGEKIAIAFNKNELNERIENELALYNKYKPISIITGYCVSVPVSARIGKIPLVWVSQSTWLQEFFENGYIVEDRIKMKWLQKKVGKLLSFILIVHSNLIFLNIANQLLKQYGCKTYKNVFDFWKGDYNLLAEPPGFSPIAKLPSNYYFIGPLPAHQFELIPKELGNLPKNKPVIYFAMGSVGKPSIIAKILKGFEGTSYSVIAPVKSYLTGMNIKVPSNVFVTDWLPAGKINQLADIAIIHGGIGSVFTAALSGKPVIGIGMQFEQDGNLCCLVKKGFAIRYYKHNISAKKIIRAVEKLLNDEDAKTKAKEYKLSIEGYNGPKEAANFLNDWFN